MLHKERNRPIDDCIYALSLTLFFQPLYIALHDEVLFV